MGPLFRRRICHPFYTELRPVPAPRAAGLCEALWGAPEELRAAAPRVRVTRAVFPVLDPRDPFLPDETRDLLWDLFEVPIYAVVTDRRGAVVAWECEAQDGLHVLGADALRAPAGEIVSEPCECGRPGARLRATVPVSACEV